MDTTDPRHIHYRISELLRNGDLEGLIALYEEQAVLAVSPNKLVQGREAICRFLQALIDQKGTHLMEHTRAIQNGDVALVMSRWSFVVTNAEGEVERLGATGTDVMRRQRDGTWKIAIDDAWGDQYGLPTN